MKPLWGYYEGNPVWILAFLGGRDKVAVCASELGGVFLVDLHLLGTEKLRVNMAAVPRYICPHVQTIPPKEGVGED